MARKAEIKPLQWDTEYFGIRCDKAVVYDSDTDFSEFCQDTCEYEFVTIQNIGNNVEVNKQIAINTSAYLVDVNIQFEKEILTDNINGSNSCIIMKTVDTPDNIRRKLTVEKNDFKFSKFVCDDELKKRNGYLVYSEWLKNACKDANKYFALFMSKDNVCAYILFNIDNNVGTIELVKVAKEYQGQHIATSMIESIEKFLADKNITKLRVGTQVNNIPAINLYHSIGFKEISRTSVFHLWK